MLGNDKRSVRKFYQLYRAIHKGDEESPMKPKFLKEVILILDENPELAETARNVICDILPAIRSALETGKRIELAPRQFESVTSFLDLVKLKASPALDQSIMFIFKMLTISNLNKVFFILFSFI